MPLIMEDGINVDDLFGEPSSLGLGLPPASSTKGLAQRLDEMRLIGCCQKVAWSRLGCIAYISHDSLRVSVRHLQCQPSDGKWVLSDDTPLHPVTEAHGAHPLVHLCWNEMGSELAVVDSSGRVSIYSILVALNSIAGLRQAAYDPDDDGSQIVGMMWLNTQRSVHAFYQAAKVNSRWAYSAFRRRPIGPFHPTNKAALLCVTRSGLLRLLYQNPDSKWTEISAELKNTGYSDRLLTHAAITATQGGILIATNSTCQKICLYRVQLNWIAPQPDPTQLNQPPLFPTPSFRFVHCKIEIPNNILRTAANLGGNNEQSPPLTNSFYSLTRLEIIPGPLDNPAGTTANPWILGVFSSPLHPASNNPEQQMPPSIMIRWQIDATPSQTLHPKFDEVASKKSSAQSKTKMELRRLEDIYCDKYVVSVDQTEYGNALAVAYDDSSVAFYDPKTMALFNGVDDTNMVTTLAQAGFHFLPDATAVGLHTSFSPSCCAAVMLDSDGQIHLRLMEHSYGADGDAYDENKFSVAIAALTLAFCRGCGSDINADDILMTVLRQLSGDAQLMFINEVYRALPINCNFTVEQDKLMNHTYIPRCLSVQAALGFKDKYKPRSFASTTPWVILHLRHASLLFACLLQYNKAPQLEPHDPDVLRMVLGNTKWALDFLHYILNELFELADEFEPVFSDQEAFAHKLKSANSLPLMILLSSMSRAFLRFICRGLRGVYAGYASYANSPNLIGDARIFYAEICQTLDSSPVRVDVYEKFLAGVDSAVRHAYHGAGFGDAERPGPEKDLLVNARIPPVLVTAVATILRQTIPALKPEINHMAIYLGDYSWLGYGRDSRTELYKRRRDVDVLKKIPLRTILPSDQDGTPDNKQQYSQRRRRCARCCEVSGDIHPARSMIAFRMIGKLGLVRSCLCGGMWTLELGSGQTSTPTVTQASARTPAMMTGLAGPS